MIRERIEERLARVAVSTHLGVPVKRFEDGKASGQVDALIEQGTDYPLEVVSAHDVQGLQLLAATKRYGPVIDAGLSHHWYVRLRPTARMREIHRIILKSLPAPESAVVLGGVDPPDSLGRLGVRSVSAAPAPEGNGSVWFMYPVNFGSGGTDELGEWASAYLASQPDVAEKLGRHGGDQRHAFVWMGHNAFPPPRCSFHPADSLLWQHQLFRRKLRISGSVHSSADVKFGIGHRAAVGRRLAGGPL